MIVCGADELFGLSLQAELARQPHLLGLTPKSLTDEPGILFRGRLKGYFLCPKLRRTWVLQTMSASMDRGEYFVHWTDPSDGSSHDGTLSFAHFFTMNYIRLHQPGMSVVFDRDGALKTTSVHFQKLRDYIWAHRRSLARRTHDMAKQNYATKKYSLQAWKPLQDWVYALPPVNTKRICLFNKTDEELHTVVAQCLWNLAHAANHPWGVTALKPSGYSSISISKKVKCPNIHSVSNAHHVVCLLAVVVSFFFIYFYLCDSHMNMCWLNPCDSVIYRCYI